MTAIALLGLFLFVYILIRALTLGFTFDEALSYNEFVQHDMGLFGPLTGDLGANHHPLNTFGMKFFIYCFGNEVWVMRIPNLFCGALFLFFGARICLGIFKSWNALFAFAVLAMQHFILDYFSIARGYGMALGFGMASVYFILDLLFWSKKDGSLYLFLLCVVAGVLSNLTFLYFFITGWFCIALWMPQKKKIAQHLLAVGIFTLAPVILYYLLEGWILDLKATGTLYFGTKNDFYLNTLVSLGKVMIYDLPLSWVGLYVLPPLGVVVFLAGAIYYVRGIFKEQALRAPSLHDILFIMLAGTVTLTIGAVIFADSLYPLDRTAFPILLLFLLQGITLVANVRESIRRRILWIFSSLSFLAFVFSMNFDYVLLHQPDQDTEEIMGFVNEHASRNRDTSLFNSPLASDFVFLHTGNFYWSRNRLMQLNALERLPDYNTAEYVLIMKDSRHYADTFGLEPLKRYPHSGSIVFHRDLRDKGKILLDTFCDYENRGGGEDLKKNITLSGVRSGKVAGFAHPSFQFIGFFEIKLPDTLSGVPVAFSAKGWFRSPKGNRAILVMEFLDSSGVISWEGIQAQHFNAGPGEWNQFKYTRFVPLHYRPGTVCKVYLWNIGKDTTFVDDIRLRMVAFPQ